MLPATLELCRCVLLPSCVCVCVLCCCSTTAECSTSAKHCKANLAASGDPVPAGTTYAQQHCGREWLPTASRMVHNQQEDRRRKPGYSLEYSSKAVSVDSTTTLPSTIVCGAGVVLGGHRYLEADSVVQQAAFRAEEAHCRGPPENVQPLRLHLMARLQFLAEQLHKAGVNIMVQAALQQSAARAAVSSNKRFAGHSL